VVDSLQHRTSLGALE
jgi:hypothetical protein